MHTLARPAPSDATGRTGQRACTPRTRGSGWHTSGQPLAACGARPAAPPRLVDPCGGPPRPVVGPRAARARRASARAPDTRPRCRGAGNDCREAPRCTASCSAGTPCTRPPTAGASAPPEARLVQPPAPLAHLRGWASVPRSLPPHATERALLARHAIRRPPRASAAATWRAAPSPRSRSFRCLSEANFFFRRKKFLRYQKVEMSRNRVGSWQKKELRVIKLRDMSDLP